MASDAGAVSTTVSADDAPHQRRSHTSLHQQASLPVGVSSSAATASSSSHHSHSHSSSPVPSAPSEAPSLSNYAFTFTPTPPKARNDDDVIRGRSLSTQDPQHRSLSLPKSASQKPELLAPALAQKLVIGEMREPGLSPLEKTRVQAKGSDDSGGRKDVVKRSEPLPSGSDVSAKPSTSLDEDDKVYIVGFLSKKNERLVGWRRARNRAWKE